MTMEDKKANQRLRVNKFKATRPWYDVWYSTKHKCLNPKSPLFKYFGAKGIGFTLTQAEMTWMWERYADGFTEPALGRKDVDGPYSADNCKIVERSELLARGGRARWKEIIS